MKPGKRKRIILMSLYCWRQNKRIGLEETFYLGNNSRIEKDKIKTQVRLLDSEINSLTYKLWRIGAA